MQCAPVTNFLFLAETVGFFRGCRFYRLATLVATVGKNSPSDCFLPLRSLLVRIPPIILKNKKARLKTNFFIFGGDGGIRTHGTV